jgi:hypothetical protein
MPASSGSVRAEPLLEPAAAAARLNGTAGSGTRFAPPPEVLEPRVRSPLLASGLFPVEDPDDAEAPDEPGSRPTPSPNSGASLCVP